MVPASRIRTLNDGPLRAGADYVVYWMIAARRLEWNFGLDRAVEHAKALNKPLVILEALRVDYPWASDRFHRFILQGMADHAQRLARSPVRYLPFVERERGEGKGLLQALASNACVVVTDDFPTFFLPRMLDAAARKLEVRLETVDSNGLLPMRSTPRVFTTAVSFRRHLQKRLPPHLKERPKAAPLARLQLPPASKLPPGLLRRWPLPSPELLKGREEALSRLPIDHSVGPVADGRASEARRRWRRFLSERLEDYVVGRNHPDDEATSGLSPWLHFGRISVHQIFHELARSEGWTADRLSAKATGHRAGFWGMSPQAEAFLDQLITWREVGFNFCSHRDDHFSFESLPAWSRITLDEHRADPRPHLYDRESLESASTSDEIWNAAQRELVRDGRIHNYLRMLWGKRILEWSPDPEAALAALVELNDRFALDGRDPNSYSGTCWVLGRYDRAWGPERPIFGKVRFMSSANTRRKLHLKKYLERFGP